MIRPFPKPRALQHLKPEWLPKRMPVTLIAGFRCEEQVITACADSQETVIMPNGNEYRVTRQKIKPMKCGNFELAIAGTSNNAALLDACVRRIHKNTTRFPERGLAQLEEFLSNELLDFGKNDAKLYSKKERAISLLAVARSIHESRVECWYTAAAQLIPIERTKLVGWNEELYEHVLDRLYSENGPLLPPQQTVLLGMYLMELAEKTSNYVRGPISVIVARPSGIWIIDKAKVARFKEQMAVFSSQMDSLLLPFSDYTISRPQYEARLDEFKATLLQIREDYIAEAAPKTFEEITKANQPLRTVPRGTVFRVNTDLTVTTKEDPESVARIERLVKNLRGGGPFRFVCSSCGIELEYQVNRLFIESGDEVQSAPTTWNCPECTAVNTMVAKPLRYRKIGVAAAWTEVPKPSADLDEQA